MSRQPKHSNERIILFKQEPGLEDNRVALNKDNHGELHHSAGPVTSHDPNNPASAERHFRVTPSPLPEVNQEGNKKADLASTSQLELYQRLRLNSDSVSAMEVTNSTHNCLDSAYTSVSDYTDVQPIDCSVRSSGPPLASTERLIAACELKESIGDAPESKCDQAVPCNTSSVLHHVPATPTVLPEDPMAGMLALVKASEMPQAGTSHSVEISLLESNAAEGMALLSQMAEMEMQSRQKDHTLGKTFHQKAQGVCIFVHADSTALWEDWRVKKGIDVLTLKF